MRDEIIKMARGIGCNEFKGCFMFLVEDLERFYNEAVQHERDAIAKFIQHDYKRQFEEPWRDNLCKQIRARGEK